MREIEVLVKLFNRKEKALKALRGFRHEGTDRTLDIYYNHPGLTILHPEKNGRLRECLRLRAKNRKCFITYKKDHFDRQDIWRYSDEHETKVDSFEVTSKILKDLGFEVLVKVDSIKHKFIHRDFEIVLEEVRGLGLFLEVEHKGSSKINPGKIKENIRKFIILLGLRSEEVNMGKPEMLLRKKRSKKS